MCPRSTSCDNPRMSCFSHLMRIVPAPADDDPTLVSHTHSSTVHTMPSARVCLITFPLCTETQESSEQHSHSPCLHVQVYPFLLTCLAASQTWTRVNEWVIRHLEKGSAHVIRCCTQDHAWCMVLGALRSTLMLRCTGATLSVSRLFHSFKHQFTIIFSLNQCQGSFIDSTTVPDKTQRN